MIIATSPLRISFFGGGSDLPSFFTDEPGQVLSATIDKCVQTVIRPHRRGRFRISTDGVQTTDSIHQIEHDFTRETLLTVGCDEPVDIGIFSDVRSTGTGLGTSGAVVTSLVAGLAALRGEYPNATEIARLATDIEIDRCGRPVGLQDQNASAHGGLRAYTFEDDRQVTTRPVTLPAATLETLQRQLLLVDTSLARDAGNVLAAQSKRMSSSKGSRDRVRKMVELARVMTAEFDAGRIENVGPALHEAWTLKSEVLRTTSGAVVDLYEHARAHGATGGKLLGAGGGGHMLFVVPEADRDGLLDAVGRDREVPFAFSGRGTHVAVV